MMETLTPRARAMIMTDKKRSAAPRGSVTAECQLSFIRPLMDRRDSKMGWGEVLYVRVRVSERPPPRFCNEQSLQ